MKQYLTFLTLVGFLIQFSFGQHIPPSHDHTTSICYGYATGRAFGLTQWSGGDCPLETLNLTAIPNEYFDTYPYSLDALEPGDIIYWGGHATYLVNTLNYLCDNVNGEGQSPQSRTLASLISEWLQPISIKRRKKDLWEIRAQNDFGGGKIGYQGFEYNSPFDKYGLDWKSGISVTAVDDGRIYTFKKVFQRWEDAQGALVSTNPTALLMVGENHHILKTYTAIFLNEYNVRFENDFVELSNTGIIKVNGIQYNLPHNGFPVLHGSSISVEALNQTINSIYYEFNKWDRDGSTSRYKTIFPIDEIPWVAEFDGKPLRVQNLHDIGAVGQPIHLVWDVHPNSNCQYKIWRKIKPYDPVLIATRSHSTTSYIDYDILRTSSYSDELLSYDVRAYYTIENTSADPWWYTIYGTDFFPKPDSTNQNNLASNQIGAENILSSYPNPFNASTTIQYHLPQAGWVKLAIYDARGRKVKILVNGCQPEGWQTVQWDGASEAGVTIASGIYWLRLDAHPIVASQKILLLK